MQERKNNIRQHELDYLAARLAALNKKPEEAIKNLALAVNYGWREWWTENDPLFSELKAMPEFQQQVKIIKDQIEWFQLYSESKGFLQNDVLAVVKPMQETVDEFQKRSAGKDQGSVSYCEIKKKILIKQSSIAARAVLARF